MSMLEKVSVDVTVEMAALVREAVASGDYASTSEVIREALRDWKTRRVDRQHAVVELGRLWDEGLASGDPRDGEAAFARVKEKLEASLSRS